MKNKFIFIFFFSFFCTNVFAENLKIKAKNITLDKNKKISIFENEVLVETDDGIKIESDYVEYNKENRFLILKKNIKSTDIKKNTIETEYAEYDEIRKIFISKGPTKIITSENYVIESEDIILNKEKNFIKSKEETKIIDKDKNIIFLDNFEYLINKDIFKSVGKIKIEDSKQNTYNFSQIYIDTKKKEILGTDIKAFLNNEDFKYKKENKPRIFANTLHLKKDNSSFKKGVFTLCNYREKDKCPPWEIRASEIRHSNKKKTVYYDNAVVKVYNIPILYIPKLSHPDPSVERRSGFLPPLLTNTKNLGSGISIPYFFDVSNDKNFTLSTRIFSKEHPLFIGDYHQAFKDSSLLTNFGYTQGYKKSSTTKKTGEKSHFFAKYVKNFSFTRNSKNTLNLTLQDVSNDKYLKLYKIKSNLVDYNNDTLENSLNFTHEDDDIFFGLNASVYETLKDNYNDKYEFILPEITFDKNLFSSNNFGNLDLQTNFKINNYDTNKITNFLINDFNWSSNELNFKNGIKSKLIGHFKNINYEVTNENLYKKDPTNELHGALGYLSEINLQKKNNDILHLFTPKMLLRYSPGEMRKESSGSRLNPTKAFEIERIDNMNNFEKGLSATIGFDYKINKNDKNFDFSLAQIINEKENKKMSSKTSLDEKLSDLVGSAHFDINDKLNLNYKFALDQNFSDFNYNELGTKISLNYLDIDFTYLEENNHIGNQKYFKSKFDIAQTEKGLFSFETKRNLISNSAEFYNLSYEYINDCLRAGLVYRREFYNDSELEPENSLMFKITLTPFGNLNSPSFNR